MLKAVSSAHTNNVKQNVDSADVLHVTDTCDEYLLYENIGMIPEDFQTIEVGDTTRAVCRRLCSETYDLTCSGFLYNRRLQTCELSPYTGEWVIANSLMSSSVSGLEFYRRIRCLGEQSLLFAFDREDNVGGTGFTGSKIYWV